MCYHNYALKLKTHQTILIRIFCLFIQDTAMIVDKKQGKLKELSKRPRIEIEYETEPVTPRTRMKR